MTSFQINLSLLSLLKSMAVHVGVDEASAGLWLNNLSSDNEEIVTGFAEQIHHLVSFRFNFVILLFRLFRGFLLCDVRFKAAR